MKDLITKICCNQKCGNTCVKVRSHRRFKNGKVEHVHEYCRAKWDTKK